MSTSSKIVSIKILPESVELLIPQNSSLTELFISAGLDLQLPCGGAGTCGKCKIQFIKGAPPPNLQEEVLLSRQELQDGIRLACLQKATADCEILIPQALRLKTRLPKDRLKHQEIRFKPLVQKALIHVPLKEIEQARSETDLILEKLRHSVQADLFIHDANLFKKISAALREQDGRLTVTIFNAQILDLEPGDTRAHNYGLVIDLGTTTIGVLLLDLSTGQTIDYAVLPNPQAAHGADLISRIQFASGSAQHSEKLKNAVQQKLTELIEQLCLQHQLLPSNIYLLLVAGNTIMSHLFWGISPKFVGMFPFKPVVSAMVRQFNAKLYPGRFTIPVALSLPLIGGFVGGDVVADMITAGLANDAQQQKVLLIDIGTNCEVVLKHGRQLVATSAPAGPALEGANIEQGMRAVAGALIDLHQDGQTMRWQSIDQVAPQGICGSGLFHIIHYLIQKRVISEEGQIVLQHPDEFWNRRIVVKNRQAQKILLVSKQEGASRDIYLSQKDIRQFQLANAAISTAWCLLCKTLQVEPAEIDKVVIAGAFGNFIRPLSMTALGTIPALKIDRVQFIGNGSLEGLREIALNKQLFDRLTHLSNQVRFVELASDPQFQEVFVEHLKLRSRKG